MKPDTGYKKGRISGTTLILFTHILSKRLSLLLNDYVNAILHWSTENTGLTVTYTPLIGPEILVLKAIPLSIQECQ